MPPEWHGSAVGAFKQYEILIFVRATLFQCIVSDKQDLSGCSMDRAFSN